MGGLAVRTGGDPGGGAQDRGERLFCSSYKKGEQSEGSPLSNYNLLFLQALPCSWLRYGAISGVKGAAEEQLLNSKLLLRGNFSSCNDSKHSDEMV